MNNGELLSSSLDYQDDLAVVGAANGDTLLANSGVVYIFQKADNRWRKIASLVPSDVRANHFFGGVVKIAGDYIYVGDGEHSDGVTTKGQVYVFKKPTTGWENMTETFVIEPSDPKARRFGRALDTYGDALIIGAPFSIDDNGFGMGAAYVYRRQGDSWTQEAKFSSPNTLGSTFGSGVALKENLAAVSADSENYGTFSGPGNAYVFEKAAMNPWTDALPVAKLSRSQSQEYSYNGIALAIDELRETVFINSDSYNVSSFSNYKSLMAYVKPVGGWTDMTETTFYRNDSPESYSFLGKIQFDEPHVYLSVEQGVKVFEPDENNTWNNLSPVSLLRNDDYSVAKRFGYSMRASNGGVLVGAPAHQFFHTATLVEPELPAVYEFVRPLEGWVDDTYYQESKFGYWPLTTTDFAFGEAIAIDGDFAVVGSPRDIAGGRNSGAVYVYQLIDLKWHRIARLTPSDGEVLDRFGGTVAISGNHIAVGSPNKHYRENETGTILDFSLGAVYIFERPAGGWTSMTETKKLVNTEEVGTTQRNKDYFGTAVAMDFPYLAVSRYDHGSRPNSGSVFIYNLTGDLPVLEARLDPSSRTNVNNFGYSIKIKNDVIAIGCGAGRFPLIERNLVFVYNKPGDRWLDAFEDAKLYPSDATGNLQGISFGHAIDMNERATKIIVGAPLWREVTDTFVEGFKGAAYIYEKPIGGWQGNIAETARLTVPDQPSYGCMGTSVYIEDRYAAVGSPQNFFFGIQSNPGPGRTYFYQMPEGGWSYKLPDKILRGDENNAVTSDYFGSAVNGVFGYLMVGAIADDNDENIDAGSVYIYSEYPFIFPGQSPICENAPPIQLAAYPEGGMWSGGGIDNPATGVFSPELAGAGVSRIQYKVDDCDAPNALLIEVREVVTPFVLADTDSLYFCGNPDIKLTVPHEEGWSHGWEYGETNNDFLPMRDVLPFTYATKEGFYRASISNFCSTETALVWIGDLHPNAGEGFAVCASGNPIQLNGNYPTGIWSGKGISSEQKFNSSLAGPGEHVLTFKVSPYPGCVYQDTLTATVKRIDNFGIVPEGENSYCYTGFTKFTATSVDESSYEWYYTGIGEEQIKLGDGRNVLSANGLGLYKVKVSDGLCAKEATYNLIPNFRPSVEPWSSAVSLCGNSPMVVQAQIIEGADYEWTVSQEGISHLVNSLENSSMTIKESGSYRLRILSHGCEFLSPAMDVHRIPTDSLFVPNVITPNGDEANETLKIYANEGVGKYNLVIINRNGKEVFRYSGTSGLTGWSGDDLPSGVYFWALNYLTACENKFKTFNGTITLIK